MRFVYTVVVAWPGEAEWLAKNAGRAGIERFEPAAFDEPQPGNLPLSERPIVVGSGPGGLLAAYYLAVRGYRPLVLERGEPVKERVPAIRAFDRGGPLDRENNYLFGEGGAGTFSDGKLTCRMSGPDVDWVLERFVECGGKPEIRYEQRPHLGSNRLPMLVRNFRRKIEAARRRISLSLPRGGAGYRRWPRAGREHVERVLAGVGRDPGDRAQRPRHLRNAAPRRRADGAEGVSARPAHRTAAGAGQSAQVRRPREAYERILGAADYSLVARGQRDLFTFCMCAGGVVIPSVSEPGMFCTNGMSNSRHDTPFANSGLMVTLEPGEFGSDHPLAGVELQRQFEAAAFELGRGSYLAPIQRAADFLAGRTPASGEQFESSYPRGVVPANLNGVLPPVVLSALRTGLPLMDRQWRGDFLRNATLVGPEMRGSSPVRIGRERDSRQTPGIAGLYPVGEGAGYAGGIISAAVDGLRTAKQIVQQFALPA